jgi:hypothetical protein
VARRRVHARDIVVPLVDSGFAVRCQGARAARVDRISVDAESRLDDSRVNADGAFHIDVALVKVVNRAGQVHGRRLSGGRGHDEQQGQQFASHRVAPGLRRAGTPKRRRTDSDAVAI